MLRDCFIVAVAILMVFAGPAIIITAVEKLHEAVEEEESGAIWKRRN